MTKHIKISPKLNVTASRYVKSDSSIDNDIDDVDSMLDAVDDVADAVDDIQDSLDDMDEDDVNIAVNNNITNHYIAECEKCQGVFISPIVNSSQGIDKVTGICPLCNKESDQYLRWIIKDVADKDSVDILQSTKIKPKNKVVASAYLDDLDNIGYGDWQEIDHKNVLDSDGFYTDYTLYTDGDTYIAMFGDKDIYGPDPDYADAEFDDEDSAREWFDCYNGFDEED